MPMSTNSVKGSFADYMGRPSSSKLQCLTVITNLFVLTAFVLTFAGSLSCNFVKFTDASGTDLSRGFGIWFYQAWSVAYANDGAYTIVRTCQEYPDSVALDASWKAARAFAVLSYIFALVVVVGKCAMACCYDPTKRTTSASGRMAPLYLLLALFKGLNLLFLDGKVCKDNALTAFGDLDFPDTCSLDVGAQLTISATAFWAAAAVAAFFEHKAWEEWDAETPAAGTEPLVSA